MRRRVAPAALLLACVLGAAQAFAYTPHELRWSDGLDISSLNTFLATTGNAQALSELGDAEFTRLDAKGNAQPELITEIPTKANGGISADGKTITWHLRSNLKWSDGQPLDASDVEYTYRVAIDPANNLSNRTPWTRLTGVTARDKNTVIFHFKQPYALFLEDYFRAASNSTILPKHLLGPGTAINEAPYNALPVGAGPFRYTAYHRGEDVEMEANPYYWRGKPKLDRIVYKIVTDDNTLYTQMQTGEVDLWDGVNGVLAQRVRTLAGHTVRTRLTNYMSAVFLNCARPVMKDPAVRRALEAATDRAAMLEKVALGNGVPAQSVVPQTSVDAVALPVVAFHLAAANTMLDAAGWKRGADGMRSKNGLPLTVDLAIPTGYAPSATAANLLHDDWGRIGVNVVIHPYATAQYFALYSNGGIIQTGKFDAALYSQSSGPVYANINGVWDCASFPPNGLNAARYCNPKVDALNDRYVEDFDARSRHAEAAAVQRAINADAAAIVNYERTGLSVADARVSGYHPNSFSDWGDPLELDI